jgi:hypothetical protein
MSARIDPIRSMTATIITLISNPATNACGETDAAPNSAINAAASPNVGNEYEANPLVVRREKRRYIKGNVA